MIEFDSTKYTKVKLGKVKIPKEERTKEQHVFLVCISRIHKEYSFAIKPFNTETLKEKEELV
ncbi:hypothetical protein DVK85_04890 [Flavobacterium arcticum]|uniref:Uncharacterized protein n=1 Tax=Flavobacterium arcticum TaxID=1784713 RepID=A0A345HAJ0_9FLAO|nr:hypothetical protein [Flavobacterium arcticum]AXG73600.1 hypothetical protein DVK85_04890 [Flavobacterium arcticum]KAF2506421.1 hypothetical protein E0W72_13270 [Flavobacterium arcticum]